MYAHVTTYMHYLRSIGVQPDMLRAYIKELKNEIRNR